MLCSPGRCYLKQYFTENQRTKLNIYNTATWKWNKTILLTSKVNKVSILILVQAFMFVKLFINLRCYLSHHFGSPSQIRSWSCICHLAVFRCFLFCILMLGRSIFSKLVWITLVLKTAALRKVENLDGMLPMRKLITVPHWHFTYSILFS